MKVVGFSFIRNAVKLDYPIVEAITSILPICDEFIVMVGNSDDTTLALIQTIGSDKIKIYESIWDESLREGGRVLADETNKALAKMPTDADWAFYIQGDEVIHEKYLPTIQQEMQRYKDDEKVDGLLLKYLHFYGSYDYIGDSRKWYRREIRIIRPNKGIYSYRDAQGFRKPIDKKLNVKLIDAYMYHYGWVRPPKAQLEKHKAMKVLWNEDIEALHQVDEFDYAGIDSLAKFEGSHPKVVHARIERMNWKFEHDISKKNLSLKSRILGWVEKYTGWRVGEYKNYRII